MNPDRSRSRMTIDALMQIGMYSSAVIPVVFIAVLGWYASQRLNASDATPFVLMAIACTILVLLGVLTINYFVQRQIKDRLLGLISVYRDFASGDRTIRAPVSGEDEFAMLSMSLNTLLDNQKAMQDGVALADSENENETAQCPSCSKPLRSGDRFCSQCGSPLLKDTPSIPLTPKAPTHRTCLRCRAPLQLQDQFCGTCGTHIVPSTGTTQWRGQ